MYHSEDYSDDQSEVHDEPDWDDYPQFEDEEESVSLDATDYIALFIAALQTIFLPLVILMVFLLTVGLILTYLVP